MPRVACETCDKVFYAKPSHIKKGWGKYCSRQCQYLGQKTGKSYPCFVCRKPAYKTPKDLARSKSGRFFCSKSCQTVWRNSTLYVGKNHGNWNGGTASYRSILTKTNAPQVCAKCSCVDKRVLAVHHKDRNRKNNAVSNLTWLCHNCHFLVHHFKTEANGFVVPVA